MLMANTKEGEKTLLSVENNIKRSYHVELDEDIVSLKLKVFDNWGESEFTKIVSFDFN